MSEEEQLYVETGNKIKDAHQSQLFGKPCFKINSKAFISFFENCMVFKLTGEAHKEALALNNSKLFDPSGKKRPMKEWVQVTGQHKEKWYKFAKEAHKYVASNS
jgi:hypothetical protein